jgi:hypothetical protein
MLLIPLDKNSRRFACGTSCLRDSGVLQTNTTHCDSKRPMSFRIANQILCSACCAMRVHTSLPISARTLALPPEYHERLEAIETQGVGCVSHLPSRREFHKPHAISSFHHLTWVVTASV